MVGGMNARAPSLSRSTRTRLASAIALALALASSAGAALVACQDTSGGDGAGGGAQGGASGPGFQPKGCAFSVAPRAEYTDFSHGKLDVGATPNIRRVRLGLGGNVTPGAPGRADPSTTIGVAWQTDDGTLASQLRWGTTPDPASWPAENLAEGVTWLTPAGTINASGDERMHEAYVCGLSPATTYYYRVGGGAPGKEAWSDVYAFTTTPSAPDAPVVLAVSGDSRGQQQDAWRLLQRAVMKAGATVQLFSGDMINFAPDQAEWEKWLDLGWKDADGTLLSTGQLLTLSAHGNHDNHTSLFFGNMVLPQDLERHADYAELFFSVDVGAAHVVVVDDAFVVSPTGDARYAPALAEWLEADLAAAEKNRAKVPWIIVMHHHPELSSSTHGKDTDVLRGRAFFMPIWDAHHVDLSIAGHDHDYERSKPTTGPADSPKVKASSSEGTTYLVCAGAGADAYAAGTSAFTATSRDYKSGGALGFYSLLRVGPQKLVIESHELRADGSDPTFDTAELAK
jgi:hypothetical protein